MNQPAPDTPMNLGRFDPLATLAGHTEAVWSVAWHPSGKLLASCSSDKSVRIWGPRYPSADSPWDTKAVLDGGHKRTVRSVSFAPSGNMLATASFDATIGIWDRDPAAVNDGGAGELEFDYAATLEGHESEAKSVAWSSDGGLLATCSRDKSVWIWEVLDENDFECLSVLQEHGQDVKMVRWHPSEEVLASASYDDTIRLWRDDSDDWYCASILKGHTSTVWAVDFDPTGEFLISCSDDQSLRVWHYSAADRVSHLVTIPNAHARAIYSVSWSRHLPLVATASGDSTVKVWRWSPETRTLALQATLDRPHGPADVNCVAWNPNADQRGVLATCSDDGEVKLWRFTE
ncbi:Cytosolic iron-sulfur protein assembly protein [Blastocladiella emersonii ATCC 22665]|nr:Cytosolic iron-sulfur protein assembly protein [Blastocladiella emersonii ATCC 22665]